MLRLFRSLGVLVAALMVFAALPTPAVHAQSNGITSDSSYESPTFGFVVEWAESWYALEDQTVTDDSGDVLALFSDDYGARVDIYSFPVSGRTAQVFADSYLSYLQDNYDDLKIEKDIAGSRTHPAYSVSMSLPSGAKIDSYFEVQIADDALILSEVRAAAGTGLLVAVAASIDITINGDPLLEVADAGGSTPAKPTEEPTNKGGSKTGGKTTKSNLTTYESPTFGSTFQYDPKIWEVVDEATADENDGRDVIVLESEDIPARIYVENYAGYDGKAADCIDAAAAEVVGSVRQATLLQDEDGDTIKGSSRGKTWVAYAFGTDGEAAYIECRALPQGAGVLVLSMITYEDSFPAAFDAALDLLDTVSLDGAGTVTTTKGGTTDKKSGRGGKTAAPSYESPSFGYTLSYDDAQWTFDSANTTDGGADQLTLEGPNGETVLVQGMAGGRGASAEGCVSSYADAFQSGYADDLAASTDKSGKPIAGTDDFGYYAFYSFMEQGEPHVLFLECGASPDGSVYLLFVAVGPVSDVEAIVTDVTELIASVEF